MHCALSSLWTECDTKYKYKYNSYFYCAPYSLTDVALQKSANTCFTAVGRLRYSEPHQYEHRDRQKERLSIA